MTVDDILNKADNEFIAEFTGVSELDIEALDSTEVIDLVKQAYKTMPSETLDGFSEQFNEHFE